MRRNFPLSALRNRIVCFSNAKIINHSRQGHMASGKKLISILEKRETGKNEKSNEFILAVLLKFTKLIAV